MPKHQEVISYERIEHFNVKTDFMDAVIWICTSVSERRWFENDQQNPLLRQCFQHVRSRSARFSFRVTSVTFDINKSANVPIFVYRIAPFKTTFL